MKRVLIILAIILLISVKSIAQIFSGTTTAQFLKIEVGAKSIAMGGAFVSLANDASAIYWNPAGLPRLEHNMVTISHTYWLAEISHDFAGLILKLDDQHTIAVSYTLLSMPDMKVRNEFYQEGTGEYFSASDFVLGVSYGMNITEQFSIGVTGKYIGQNIWNMNASAIALDFGIRYSTPVEGLELGMSISNIGGKMKYEGKDSFVYYAFDPESHGNSDKIYADIKMDEWDLPLMYRVGLSYVMKFSDIHSFILSTDAIHPNDYNESVNTGFEYGIRERIFLRIGFKGLFKKESEEGLTAGLGLIYYLTDYLPVKVDYAYADFGRLDAIHRLSLEVGF